MSKNEVVYNQNSDVLSGSIGDIRYYVFNAGSFFTDGGSAFGILPKAVWGKKVEHDAKNRVELACNLLLLQDGAKNILIDSGIGEPVDEKIAKIYTPQVSTLEETLKKLALTRFDIDTVVLTHLHHDHIGGLIRRAEDEYELMFPNAEHIIQTEEWEIAANPDELNAAAYRYRKPIDMLKEQGKVRLIAGDYKLTEDIALILARGHTVGSQMVKVSNSKELMFYPGDIIPQKFHTSQSVTSAYDICRQQTVKVKIEVLRELNDRGGDLILNHQVGEKLVRFTPL